MLHIFSSTYWQFTNLLWSNVYSSTLSIFYLGVFSFCCWAVWVLFTYWMLVTYPIYNLKTAYPFFGIFFLFYWRWSTINFNFYRVQFFYFIVTSYQFALTLKSLYHFELFACGLRLKSNFSMKWYFIVYLLC